MADGEPCPDCRTRIDLLLIRVRELEEERDLLVEVLEALLDRVRAQHAEALGGRNRHDQEQP